MDVQPFRTVLIANRGEIAVRIMRACAELGIATVAVYSEADAQALHVRVADRAIYIGPPPATESYLNGPAIIAAALGAGAEAIHPGYGFLSENAEFAEACIAAGLVWIGPSPRAMREMGSKIAAKRRAASLGVPLLPGYDGASQDPDVLAAEAERIGYPVLIKASAGGGGRGMRIVENAGQFKDALEGAAREASAAFGDATVLLEQYLFRPRHIEVQVFGDNHGTIVHLGERECSIQRRHQKVIEESPSPAVTPELRAALGDAGLRIARSIEYRNAGTVEFLLGADGRFAFLEMNTRLQVEHAVTELVTGLDLVHLQLLVAAGGRLPVRQDQVHLRGHAIECRIYAEDASRGFLPSTGTLSEFTPPEGPGIRNDIGVRTGDSVSPYYDSMLAKLIVAGPNRDDAVNRTAEALRRFDVLGVQTNIPLLRATVSNAEFARGNTFTSFLDEHILPTLTDERVPVEAVVAGAARLALTAHRDPWRSGWRPLGGTRTVELQAGNAVATVSLRRVAPDAWIATADTDALHVRLEPDHGRAWVSGDGRETILHISSAADQVEVVLDGRRWEMRLGSPVDVEGTSHGDIARKGTGAITAPLAGTVIRVLVRAGDAVRVQQPLVILDAMKMEHTLSAPADSTVAVVRVAPGDQVQTGTVLIEFGAAQAAAGSDGDSGKIP